MDIWLTSRLLPGFAQIRTAERGAGSGWWFWCSYWV